MIPGFLLAAGASLLFVADDLMYYVENRAVVLTVKLDLRGLDSVALNHQVAALTEVDIGQHAVLGVFEKRFQGVKLLTLVVYFFQNVAQKELVLPDSAEGRLEFGEGVVIALVREHVLEQNHWHFFIEENQRRGN